ncbi:MAG: asparagine synthase (glutamine-hydrolyzing) [Campylobacterales bacterium]
MCGIAGFTGAPSPDRAKALLSALAHRGPDDRGILTLPGLTLLHTRLSIQDLAAGHQPMQRGPLGIVFNGEIYNHQALRESVKAGFKTRSDTETLLALYEKEGEAMLSKLDGMFAFALHDARDNTLFLARDRYGKKPLYYSFQNGFAFASEIGALSRSDRFGVNHNAIEAFLRFGFIPFEHTAYENIFELPAGSFLRLSLTDGTHQVRRWFDPAPLYAPKNLSDQEAIEAVEAALKNSVKSRLEASDVEVGAFLSGGIDSSLVSYYAALEKPGLKTFTVSFAGQYDEAPLAAQTALAIGSDHHEIRIETHLKNDIDRILSGYGEPFFDSSAVPSWYVAREARKSVKVVLNGDGADELFAGYRRYVPEAGGWYGLAKPLSPLAKLLPAPREKMGLYNWLFRLIESAGESDPLAFWLKTRTDIGEGVFDWKQNPLFDQTRAFLQKLSSPSPLSRALLADQGLLLAGDLLVKMDIATMAHALEGRSPFLSRELSLLAPQLPDHHKIRGRQTKWILRELARKRLGPDVADAPKRGFEVPLKNWIETDLQEPVFDRLQKPNALWKNYLSEAIVKKVLENKTPIGAEKRARLLWTLFCLETWHENR